MLYENSFNQADSRSVVDARRQPLSGPHPHTYYLAAIAESRWSSYERAGDTAAVHLVELLSENEKCKYPEKLVEQALASDDVGEALWMLMKKYLPRYLVLVPSRRKRTFIEGMLRAYEQGRME
jgi:hypothetical protein